ncbi:MAG: hypothetical protein RLZZ188_27 [Verrucomicrobiota bacterium]|jgi:hypothetical protein
MSLLLSLPHVPIPKQAPFAGRVSNASTNDSLGNARFSLDGATVVIFREE